MYLQGIGKVIDDYMENQSNPGQELAEMLKSELTVKFAYVHDPSNTEYSPIYLCATFLSPIHRHFLSAEQCSIVEEYLKGILNIFFRETFKKLFLSLSRGILSNS